MSRSNNRNLSDIANPNNNLISVSNNDVTITGAGVTQYDSADLLPTSGVITGTQAYVAATGKLYIRGDGGWYNIATVNQTPTMTSVLDSGGGGGPFVLATDGSVTRITTTATDPEGFPITFTATPDADFNNLASVSIDSTGGRIFTITPFSEDSASTTSGTITFKASDGINVASSVNTFILTFFSDTVNSQKSTFLVKATGNGVGNSSITDISSNNLTLTTSGNNIHASSRSPYRQANYSWEFDGTGDQITVATDSDLSFGTGDFTIEFWMQISSGHDGAETLFDSITAAYTDSIYINVENNNGVVAGVNKNSSELTGYDGTMGAKSALLSPRGVWTHVALVRSSGTVTLYINGRAKDSETESGSITNAGTVMIGGDLDGNFHGKLFDFRITKIAVYTADFTPPIKLTAISNTELLTCAGPFKDTSSRGRTLTLAGDINISVEQPHDYATFSEGRNGGSVHFSSSVDHLSTTITAIGTNAFTIEGWFNAEDNQNSSNGRIFTLGGNNNSGGFSLVTRYSTGNLELQGPGGTSLYNNVNNIATYLDNSWHHFALVRTSTGSNGFKFYIDGVAVYTGTLSTNLTATALDLGSDSAASDYEYYGYISDFRISGVARYSADFNLPTSPFSSDGNTSLLIRGGNNANIFDATGSFGMQLKQNTVAVTTKTKNASSSLYSDGTAGGGAFLRPHADNYLGSDNFTLEFWFWTNTEINETSMAELSPGSYSSNVLIQLRPGYGVYAYIMGSNLASRIAGFVSTMGSDANSISSTDWTHVVITRVGNVFSLFLNGAAASDVPTRTASGAIDNSADIIVGGGAIHGYNGWIEDFRLSIGHVRYPVDPLKATLSSTSDTFLLAAHTSNASTVVGDWTVTATNVTASDFAPAPGMKSIYFNGASGTILKFAHTGASSVYRMGDKDNGAADDWSLETWLYWDNSDSFDTAVDIFSNYGGGAATSSETFFFLFRSDGNFRVRQHSTTGSTNDFNVTSSSGVKPRTWHHIYYAEEYSGSTMYWRLFFDGIVVRNGTISSTSFYDFQNISIGSRHDGSSPLTGYLSNFRIQRGTVAFPKAAYNEFNPPTSELLA